MTTLLPYVILGITTGSIYGLAAMGLVLTYKTSGVFNFAHGAVGAVGAYTYFVLADRLGLPWPIAVALATLGAGLVLGLVLERFAVALASLPTSRRIVATIGLLLGIRGLCEVTVGYQAFRPFLPQDTVVTIGGVPVTVENVITAALAAVAAVGLFLLFRGTRIGRSMRAVVDDPDLLDITGESPTRVRRTAWVIGAVFAAASGILFASTQQQLDSTLLSLLIVQAFGAAAIGGFTNLPLAYAGGIAVGLAQKLLAKTVSTSETFAGLDVNLPFVVLFVVLLLVPRRKLVEFGKVAVRSVSAPRGLPRTQARLLMLAGGALTLALPLLVGSKLPIWLNATTQVVLFLSLGLLVNTSGQISLCHVGFAAIGAATFGHIAGGSIPWGAALLIAGLVAVPVGALIAIPAIRLSGLFLALATLGFGILLAQFFYLRSYMFGLTEVRVPRPAGFAGDTAYYYLCAGLAALAIGLIVAIERSRLGRLLRALADSPRALGTLGASETVCRVLVFCISAFLASIAGALFAAQFDVVTLGAFPYVQSLVLLAVVVISGRRTVTAAIVGPILLFVVPGYVTSSLVTDLLPAAYGFGALAVALFAGRWQGVRLPGRAPAADGPLFAGAAERTFGPASDRLAPAPA